ncbi:T9SS type A sorting domain-containing protein [Flavobacterium nackdongense]|uniref:T9SS type A sorting domain-containing protein n=1 Tax=Flavobacterium nackdongense TaxID=2547394 RepID=A0A4V1AGB4_9FLAO|nr:T9SS type A sorting domain-containing protein [Flavobacterium nackdongense]QBN17452.1 T9SS type A sorting domain-containing protein [Flavobacterium nackdongense]
MKKKLLLLATVILSIVQSFGQVTLPLYESFNYTEGEALANASPAKSQWTSVATASSLDDQIIASPGWVTTGIPGYGGSALFIQGGSTDPQIKFTSQTSGTVYYSFLAIFKENSAAPGTVWTGADPGIQFISLGQESSTTPGNTNYTCSIFIKKSGAGFVLGINKGSSTTETTWGSTVYNLDTEYYIIASHTFDLVTNIPTSKLWVIDPATSSGTDVPNVEPAATITSNLGTTNRLNVDRIYIRQDSNAKTPGIIIDELRVATNYNTVTGTTAPLGLSKNEIAGLNVYPNPVTNGKVFISSSSSDAKKITIYDILGKQLIHNEVSNGTLDVSSLSKGVYLMKISEGASSSTRKLIVE